MRDGFGPARYGTSNFFQRLGDRRAPEHFVYFGLAVVEPRDEGLNSS